MFGKQTNKKIIKTKKISLLGKIIPMRQLLFLTLIIAQLIVMPVFASTPSTNSSVITTPFCKLSNDFGGTGLHVMAAFLLPVIIGGIATLSIYTRKVHEAESADAPVSIGQFINLLVVGVIVGVILAFIVAVLPVALSCP